MRTDHERFMRAALDEAAKGPARGNMAVGAVIVRDGEILASGHNEVASSYDITAHAETVTLRCLTVGRRELNPTWQADAGPLAGSLLYATVEPCPMCLWATCIAGVSVLVMGARHAELGISFGDYAVERLIAMTGRRLRVVTGILVPECMAMCRSGPFTPGPR